MSKVDIELLKKLRALTNAPLKDCKIALLEAGNDIEKAQEVLRKQGAIKAAKKADRLTKEGIVKIKMNNNVVVGIKLACETDFVAKNDHFIKAADKMLDILLNFNKDNILGLDNLTEDEKEKLDSIVSETISVVGENVKIIDLFRKVYDGRIYIYEHPGNKIVGVIVYRYDKDASDIAKEVALQLVAMSPEYISIEDVPNEIKQKYYNEFKEEFANSGKPENVIENIVEGKLRKFFSEIVLLEQQRIRDDSKKIKQIVPNGFEIVDIIRYGI